MAKDAADTSHDQNFKNLILDYPRQALELFAPEEASQLDAAARILPVRQEQLKQRLGDRYRELDIPLQVEWPDGRREAILFALEEETQPRYFSIHRLAHYCLDLSELLKVTRVVPVVIFLKTANKVPKALRLGSDTHSYLNFRYLTCVLPDIPYELWQDSDNLVARLNLPNMRYPKTEKIHIYASAVRGLLDLEPSWHKQAKYIDFIDIYTQLTDNEQRLYHQHYPQEGNAMMGFAQRYTEKGIQQGIEQGMKDGIQQGMLSGERQVLIRQLTRRFGPLPAAVLQQLEQAGTDQLERWADNVLDAPTLDDVFAD